MENNTSEKKNQPGSGQATASMVLGIISVVCWFFGVGSVLSVILGIIGLMCASKAKKQGCNSGIRTAGFVLSIIGLCGGSVVFVSCIACAGTLGSIAAMG